MLFQTLTVSQAAHQLLNDEYANWSYEGAHALADYLDDLWEDCCPPEFGFCHVAVRCDYSEMSLDDLVNSYGYLIDRSIPSDRSWLENCSEVMEELMEAIGDRTHCLIELDNGNYIVGCF